MKSLHGIPIVYTDAHTRIARFSNTS